ncbi:tRNA(Ile)-lysidine synthase [Colletotrichum orbiculare MAFF 240422]|uniref:tRNA(Ile)-lysidine synthetase n=1 Tax=Colletotrichum orbiculare (strain 104-T / ATCC 96160 / CBS 514.97 / LARS 414 / MAFF 240422) TaxID=1213857 RepID=N4V909_COLOR|nr:tRNA(Ile)-lysidine synthase [Colletotrichum orbiculare MAFF 240422]
MGPHITPAQVLHPIPKPITFSEFYRAVRASAPPRFPHARHSHPRRVGLAVSGGVDSMALAFLFNQLRELSPLVKLADNPLSRISALVIDHGLRPGSDVEAREVAKELRKLKHISPVMDAINWKREGVEGDPAAAPNLESIARRARYRRLGSNCRSLHIESVFLAHHEDDQYETVLMRLLAGHGSRGLRGMMAAGGIPECADIHGVHESGHVDDQARRQPLVSFRPKRKELKFMRRDLLDEMDWELYAAEVRAGLQMGWHESPYIDDAEPVLLHSAKVRARAAALAEAHKMARIKTEDAGVMLYRPLLGFSKDRLVATCEKNGVKWFEDATNADKTLTMRNAVRYMARNHELPEALKKESILRLSARCDARARSQEDEAERWIRRTVKGDFQPNVGTLVATLPSLAVRTPRRRRLDSGKRREARLAHRRVIAALIVRKMVSFVSPEKQLAQLSTLQTVVSRLFPALDDTEGSGPKRAFNQNSVLFIPVEGSEANQWYLVREPYPALRPLPEVTYFTTSSMPTRRHPQFPPNPQRQPGGEGDAGGDGKVPPEPVLSHGERLQKLHREPLPDLVSAAKPWHSWQRFQIWDGRYWIRVRGRVRSVFRIAPFLPQHAKAFREALNKAGEKWGKKDLDSPRLWYEWLLKTYAPGKVRYTLPALYAVNKDEETGEEVLRMLALPTLGIRLPGLDRWVRTEVRYRKVEWGLLERNADGEGEMRFESESRRAAESVRRKRVMSRLRKSYGGNTEVVEGIESEGQDKSEIPLYN